MSVLDTIASAAGAASNPISAIATVVEKALSFIPNPADKLALETHALDVQADLRKAELEAEAREIESNKGAQSDHYLGTARAGFCWVLIGITAWNYAGVFIANSLFKAHMAYVEVPFSILSIFATIMLGCIGVPAGIEAVKQILAMPGESSVKLPGLSASNKS